MLSNGDYWNIVQHPVAYDIGINEYMKAPFYFDRNKLIKISDGELFNAYSFTKPFAKKQRQLQSKMFWNDYLPRNQINVPKLYATTNPFRIYEDIDMEKTYISKPEYGTTGNDISLIRGNEIGPTQKNFLIQEVIESHKAGARTFRVITTYNGEVLGIYEFRNENSVVSNLAGGGTSRMCKNVSKIRDTVSKLRRLHVRDFQFCFTIGWDLMIDDNGVYVLEGNWPCGLFGKTLNKTDKFIEKVKRKARHFYALMNLT
jgi:glutathione synthase/RimK-type ligase-like ATP-grasp enzyme